MVKEAINLREGELWGKAMEEEMESLRKYETWDVFMLPNGRKPVSSKWVFRKKMNETGKVEKYKALLVAKGYSLVEVIDFRKIFSHVTKLASIGVLIPLATTFDLEIKQMDVKTSFLHGDLEEEIYMKQLEGFTVKGKKELVYTLKKSLYGLKQFIYLWYQSLTCTSRS